MGLRRTGRFGCWPIGLHSEVGVTGSENIRAHRALLVGLAQGLIR